MKRKIIPYNPRLKAIARTLRQNMTYPEIKLWQQLKGKQLLGYDFDRQKPIDEFIVDFYCKKLQLAIEVDGSDHHDPEVARKDKMRQDRLEELGVVFLRFSNSEIMTNMEYVHSVIEGWIRDWEEKSVGRSR